MYSLEKIKRDLFAYLESQSLEAVQICRQKVLSGQIDGHSIYRPFGLPRPDGTWADCGCIIGHLAHSQMQDETAALEDARMHFRGAIEKLTSFELYIADVQPGHTPDNNIYLRRLLEWIDEWLVMRLKTRSHSDLTGKTPHPCSSPALLGLTPV